MTASAMQMDFASCFAAFKHPRGVIVPVAKTSTRFTRSRENSGIAMEERLESGCSAAAAAGVTERVNYFSLAKMFVNILRDVTNKGEKRNTYTPR